MSAPPDFASSHKKLHEDCAIVPDEPLGALALSGTDALDWIQGQISQDMRGFERGQTRRGCLLAPTGQIRAILTIGHFGKQFLVFSDPMGIEALRKRADESIFIEDVAVRDLPGRAALYRGPKSAPAGPGRLGEVFEDESRLAVKLGDAVEGWLVLDRLERESDPVDLADLEAAEALRLELGIPRRGVDYDERTLPAELGEDFDRRHVSYEKGCWTGQEVVMRLRTRGHTNRTWRCLMCEGPVKAGDGVFLGGDDRVGEVSSAAESPTFGHLGAAMLKNRAVAEGDIVHVETSSGRVPARLRAFPLLPNPFR